MLPTTIGPELMPMPMSTWGIAGSSMRHFSRKRASVSIISSAVSQPFAACSGVCTGAPKKAITASPMYLSSVPRRRKTRSVIGDRYALSRWTRAVGESFSAIPANAREEDREHPRERQRERDLAEIHREPAPQKAPGEDVLHRVRVDLHAGGAPVERRHPLVECALRRGADQHHLSLQLRVLPAVHDVGDGEVLEGALLADVVDGHQPAAVHRHPDLA